MLVAPMVLEAMQTLLSHGSTQARAAAMEVLSGLPSPHAAAALALLEEWEPGTPLAAAARERREAMQAALTGARPPDDAVEEAFRDPAASYRILGPPGEGASTRVFLAMQAGMRRLVALKVHAPGGGENATRFQRAAEAMSRVIAAYRLRVFDFVVKSDDMNQLLGAVEGAVADGVRVIP